MQETTAAVSTAKDGSLTITGVDVSGPGKVSSTGKSTVLHTSRTKLDDGTVVQLLVYKK
jgi:hypothetical protein